MTREQVDAIIQDEYVKFRDKKYYGPRLPERLLHKFRIALMGIPHHIHKIDPATSKKIIAKTDESQLTMYEAGLVINLVVMLSYDAQEYVNIVDALDDHIELQEIMAKYNAVIKNKEKEFEDRRNTMYSLGGAIPQQRNNNLKIR